MAGLASALKGSLLWKNWNPLYDQCCPSLRCDMKSLNKLIKGNPKEGSPSRGDNRSWVVAIPVAAVLVGVGIFLSAVINPLFGRYVHWDWMAVLAPVLFIVAVAAVRRRWV